MSNNSVTRFVSPQSHGEFVDMPLDIVEFHKKFDLMYEGQPRLLPRDLDIFRVKFMKEELEEYEMAVEEGNMEHAFDSLLDLVYVVMGTALLHGFPWAEGWSRVQQANMAKVRATHAEDERSIRGHASDVVKPEGWKPPDHTDLVHPCEYDPYYNNRT